MSTSFGLAIDFESESMMDFAALGLVW